MDKKHLGYSDYLLIRVLKSQEVDLKNGKKVDMEFYKECLEEAKRRGIVKVVAPKTEEKKVDAPKDEEKKVDAGQ